MKKLICVFLSLWVLMSSCFAFDGDSLDYYSMDSLSPMTASALDYAVQPLAATSWDTSDQTNLARIMNAFYNPNYNYVSNSIIGWVKKLADNSVSLSGLVSDVSSLNSGLVGTSNSVLWYAREIYNDTSELHNIYLSTSNTSRMSEEIYNALEGDYDSVKSVLTAICGDTDNLNTNVFSIDSRLDSFFDWFRQDRVQTLTLPDGSTYVVSSHILYALFLMSVGVTFDGATVWSGDRTIYSRVKQLQEVLASDDDLALANSQKSNREEIEDTFLTGSSGSTSLGVSDFGDLADVGGTIKDSLSLDGNATIGSFTSGLAAADSAGQGWFSETTRSQLDAVSSTVTYSLRDPDPYNMSGWEERYYWLLGDAYD